MSKSAPAENTLAPLDRSCKDKQPLFVKRRNPALELRWWDHLAAMRDLTQATRNILARIIQAESGKDGYCYRSQERIARKCGCHVRTVVRAINTLRADGTIDVVARYRTCSRGRTSSRITVNWAHERWKDCPRRTSVNHRVTASCGRVLSDILPEEEYKASVYIPTIVVSQKQSIDQPKNPPVEKTDCEDFAAGAQSRKVQIRPEDVPFLLALLVQTGINDRREWLRWLVWAQRYNHNPAKGHTPRGLITRLVQRWVREEVLCGQRLRC